MFDSDEFIDFIVVAAPRSGTTWLAEALGEHPQIWIPPAKELNFFNDIFLDHREFNYSRGIDFYKKQFQKAPSNLLLGELTPTYYADPGAVQRIHQHFQKVKIIAILRNPAEVVFSTYLKTLEYGITKNTFELAIKKNSDYIKLGYYHRLLKPYFDLFPNNHIRIIIYEEFFSDLEQQYKDLCRFLDVDDNFLPTVFHQRINPRRIVRWKFLVKFRHYLRLIINYPHLLPLKRLITRGGFLNDLSELIIKLNLKEGSTPKLDPTTKKKLLDIYESDIVKLENMLNINLDVWKTEKPDH